MRRTSLLFASALALAALLAPSAASAYCRTTTDETFQPTVAVPCAPDGAPLWWPLASVDFYLNKEASAQVSLADTRAAADTAMEHWTHASCPTDLATCGGSGDGVPSITVRDAGDTAVHVAQYKGDGTDENVILYWDAGWPYSDVDTTLALTTVTFGADSGRIVDADIEINSDPAHVLLTAGDPTKSVYDLPSILQHETGHFLGLAHSPLAEATMNAYYQRGSISMRTLSADDVCGICNVYPPTVIEGGGCAIGGEAPGGAIALLSLGLCALGVVRRRARHSQ